VFRSKPSKFVRGHNGKRLLRTHHLTLVDLDAKSATCKVCGPTHIHVSSGRLRCAASAKTSARKYNLWKFFRITPEEYETIYSYQKEHPSFSLLLGNGKIKDAVEHRHKDGLVRGLMSNMLNKAYGYIERLYPSDTSKVLRALAEFHDNPPATVALGSPRFGIIGKAKHKKKYVYGSSKGPIKQRKGM
jgi:hypothetical protein